MEEIARSLWLVPGRPRHAINVYLAGDVLVDAGTRWARARILRALRGRPVAAHALTHAHADHQGASAAVCTALGLPLWCGAADADAMAAGRLADRAPVNAITRIQLRTWAGPAHPVARRLQDGDAAGEFEVIATPGHSPGHVSYWRAEDRTLIAGDALFGRDPVTGRPGLHEPPGIFTLDPAANRASIRRLAALRPAVAVFGHGPPWRDPDGLERFAAGLAG
ncbi:MAG: MBL fold metallo-hydrolase [Solirubrobacteraceae bacterium]